MKWLLLLMLSATAFPAQADVYRCVGPDGSATYSQTPCSSTAERMAVHTGAAGAGLTDCRYAEHFARSVSRLMRRGLAKDDAIAAYGGPEGISGSAQKILNYVYLYRRTPVMSPDRLTVMATAQCKSGSFGDVSCEALPTPYIQAGGGCDGTFSASQAEPDVDIFALNLASDRAKADERARAAAELHSQQIEKMMADYEEQERVRGCRANIQREINQIDARVQSGLPPNGQGPEQRRLREIEQMNGRPRSGADPNGERLELRRLRKSLAECR